MDAAEFPTSPSKRQRTKSPEPTMPPVEAETPMIVDANNNMEHTAIGDADILQKDGKAEEVTIEPTTNQLGHPAGETQHNDRFLDVLMQHAEDASSELSTSPQDQPPTDIDSTIQASKVVESEPQPPITDVVPHISEVHATSINGNDHKPHRSEDKPPASDVDANPQKNQEEVTTQSKESAQPDQVVPEEIPAAATPSLEQTPAQGDVAIPGLEPGPEGPEWQIDSSPYQSSDSNTDSDSDSSDSSDDSEDDDEDEDGDYAMLDPEEAARILMQGDAGSDDEGEGRSRDKPDGGRLRTANEKFEEVIPIPDIKVTEDMKITVLGNVEGHVENTVLVKAKVSGEYQVLESGSLLCLKDRAVIGVVAETLGRVEQPLYTIRFTNDDAIREAGLSEKGVEVFYVVQHSTFVFTQPLKAIKGSDASNFHDEEVGDDEMEFSDDEAEAEHKRQMKLKRQGRRDDGGGMRGRGLGRGRGAYRGNRRGSQTSQNELHGATYENGSMEINYDDVPESNDDGYTPLARPADLHEMMKKQEPREEPVFTRAFHSGSNDRGRGFGRGHDRGRGSRGRGPHRGRGGFNQHHQNSYPPANQSFGEDPARHHQGQSPQGATPSGLPPKPFNFQPQSGYGSQPMPPPPLLTPQNPPQSMTFSPSPISPLPKQQFNFPYPQNNPGGLSPYMPNTGFQQQHRQPPPQFQFGGGYPQTPQYSPPSQHYPTQNQNFGYQPQFQPSPPFGNTGYSHPSNGFGGGNQHFGNNHGFPGQHQYNGQNQYAQGSAWTPNQAAAAEVQRQLEELKRSQGQR